MVEGLKSVNELIQSKWPIESIICSNDFEGDIFEIKPMGRQVKFVPFQMVVYGFRTVFNRNVRYVDPEINFDLYDEIVLVSPVWAGSVNIYMKKYLENVLFTSKNVTIVGSCSGGYKGYFESYNKVLDPSNKIVKRAMYIKDKLV